MLLTPSRLLLLRLYNVTLGRFAWGERLFRRTMEGLVIWRKPPSERYTASAGFFDVRDLESDAPSGARGPRGR